MKISENNPYTLRREGETVWLQGEGGSERFRDAGGGLTGRGGRVTAGELPRLADTVARQVALDERRLMGLAGMLRARGVGRFTVPQGWDGVRPVVVTAQGGGSVVWLLWEGDAETVRGQPVFERVWALRPGGALCARVLPFDEETLQDLAGGEPRESGHPGPPKSVCAHGWLPRGSAVDALLARTLAGDFGSPLPGTVPEGFFGQMLWRFFPMPYTRIRAGEPTLAAS